MALFRSLSPFNSARIRLYTSGSATTTSDLLRSNALKIFRSAVKSVTPQEMVQNSLSLNRTRLVVRGREYMVYRNVHVVAFGKAVMGMVKAVDDILGPNIVRGVASIPHGLPKAIKESENEELIAKTLLQRESSINVIEGAKHNLPDETAQFAAHEIKKIAESVGEGDLLVVLISGGGSAQLPLPIKDITLREKLQTIKALASSGATIQELNTIRKHLSQLKGGKLAEIAHPAKVVSLILSDVIGDPLDIIASGPTVLDMSTDADCLRIIHKLNAQAKVPAAVMKYLDDHVKLSDEGIDSGYKVPVKQTESGLYEFCHVQNEIVGSNRIAVDAAVREAEALGYTPLVLSTKLSGEARELGAGLADLAKIAWIGHSEGISVRVCEVTSNKFINQVISSKREVREGKPLCILGAGETTVTLKGTGIGGRNQEIALASSLVMHENSDVFASGDPSKGEGVVLLSAGTDGQDGPCSAAGAMAEPRDVGVAVDSGLDPVEYLNNNDSFNFYSKLENGKNHVITGLTGTNVMDIQVLLVHPPASEFAPEFVPPHFLVR